MSMSIFNAAPMPGYAHGGQHLVCCITPVIRADGQLTGHLDEPSRLARDEQFIHNTNAP